MIQFAQRKQNRLEKYDYSSTGSYFVTLCAKNKEEIFGRLDGYAGSLVGASIARPQIKLTEIGKAAVEAVRQIPCVYANVSVDTYVIMPNHIHLIISIACGNDGRAMPAPTPAVSRIVQHFKGSITKAVGFSPWQKSFHDHILRTQQDYYEGCQYIENNPANWLEDTYYYKGHTYDTI
ncbi:MAG: hypothetical protein LBT88_02215 [Oscillospiraceae bacterium]|jgi:REP element-mobilizing transposase RayT|nr:hypothetical protein [Oscillospiraceae bacterium]